MTQARRFSIMKMNQKSAKIKEIKADARGIIMKCWAEMAMISLLNTAVAVSVYTLVIIIGILTGAHSGETMLPIFQSCPPIFIILISVLLISAYFITAPLYFGIKWYLWQMSSGAYMPVSSIFAGYTGKESIFQFMKLRFLIGIRKAAYAVLAGAIIIFGCVIAGGLAASVGSAVLRILIYAGGALIVIGTLILWGASIMKYLPAGFIAAADFDMSFKEIMSYSNALVKKRHSLMLVFYSSFFIWYIFSLLIFPLLFAVPYIDMSTAVFVRGIITNYYNEMNHDQTREEDTVAV